MTLKIYSLTAKDSNLERLTQECIQQSADQINDKQLNVLIDVDSQLPSGFDLGWLQQAVAKMLRLAIDRSPMRSEIQLTACRVGNAVEVEVADSGDTPTETWIAFQHHFSLGFGPLARDVWANVQSRGAEFWGTACPQGGMAWTLRLPIGRSLAKVA